MARQINTDKSDLFNSELYQEGFQNDITPLDEHHLNMLIDGIKLVDEEIADVIGEPTDRENTLTLYALKNNLNTTDETLSGEKAERQAFDRFITGLDSIADRNPDEEYENSNTKLRAAINDLGNAVDAVEEYVDTKASELLGNENSGADEMSIYGLSTKTSSIVNYVDELIQKVTGVSPDTHITDNYDDSNSKLRENIDRINTALGFLADTDVVSKHPSFSIKWEDAGSFESGTRHSLKYTITFNDGKYKYPLPNGTLMGCKASSYEVTFNGQTLTGATGTFNEVTFTDTTNLQATAKATFGGSPVTPKNNLGLNYPDGKQSGGTVSLQSATLSGFKRGCYYGTTTKASGTYEIDGDFIRDFDYPDINMNRSPGAYVINSVFEFDINPGTTAVIVACPVEKTGLKEVYNTKLYIDVTNTFVKLPDPVEVPDVGGTMSDYNVWVYEPAEPYTQAQKLKITLG